MPDPLSDYLPRLQHFLRHSSFASRGAVMTDLDGTAVHEAEGRVQLSRSVELGLQRVHAAGRQVLINTLRFPLSVMRVFGREWRAASGDDMLVTCLNGSIGGRIVQDRAGALAFEEAFADPLQPQDLGELMVGIRGLWDQGLRDLLVFFYPRDWRAGEAIWTADPARVGPVQAKYTSASRVMSGPPDALEAALSAQAHCMVFLLVDAPGDRLMAYQHTERSRFVTRQGVDKLHGARVLTRSLGLELADSIGAGDAEPDTFLSAVGFAVIVGPQSLHFRGVRDTVRVPDAPAFGELLLAAAAALE